VSKLGLACSLLQWHGLLLLGLSYIVTYIKHKSNNKFHDNTKKACSLLEWHALLLTKCKNTLDEGAYYGLHNGLSYSLSIMNLNTINIVAYQGNANNKCKHLCFCFILIIIIRRRTSSSSSSSSRSSSRSFDFFIYALSAFAIN
jgi:hypothetical protein